MSRKALCVGINRFRNFPDASLNGCVNDAIEMKALLTEFFGFGKNQIRVLKDEMATKSAIMDHLRAMVEGAKNGRYGHLVFSLSSHGTQIPDTGGDEPDRADEAFCPSDLSAEGDKWHPDHIIADDELYELFTTLPEKVSLEVFLDTCHSGTGLRAPMPQSDRKPRYIPPPTGPDFGPVSNGDKSRLYNMFRTRGSGSHILWSGCMANQTSADAHIEGQWHGAFTYYFCHAIRAGADPMKRPALLKKIGASLKANRFTQIPQLEMEATKRGKN